MPPFRAPHARALALLVSTLAALAGLRAQAAPPGSLAAWAAETPAGRYLVSELGLAAVTSAPVSARAALLEERFGEIERRFLAAAGSRGARGFARGGTARLGKADRELLEAIAREELARPGSIRFVPVEPEPTDLLAKGWENHGTTVEVRGRVRGRHGHAAFLLGRVGGKPWTSLSPWREVQATPQGDPRWLIQAHEELASFLGFQAVSSDLMIVPGPRELNAGIARLNAALEREGLAPIPLSFSDSKGVATSRDYALRFLEGSIPVGTDGHMLAHDLSFHAAAILLPAEALAPVMADARLLLAFEASVRSGSPGLFAREDSRDAFARAWEELAIRLDSGTGLYGPEARVALRADASSESYLDLARALLSSQEATPAETIAQHLSGLSSRPRVPELRAELDRFVSGGEGARLNAPHPKPAREAVAVRELQRRAGEIGRALRALRRD